MATYLDSDGLLYFWEKIKGQLGTKVDKVEGKTLTSNDFTDDEKTKLAGIAANANKYSLPTASASTLGGVKVGTNLSISSGVLSATDTTYDAATTSAAGLMSAADKTKLDGIATGANKYSLPTASATTLGGIKVGTNLTIASGVLSAVDTTYSAATQSAAGLMSADDKKKLDGIAAGASSNAGTVTSVTISATSPIAIDSSAAITSSGTRTISHATSGATAGSYGDSANQTPAYGGTFKVPYVTVNATGHVTGITEHTVKIPASDKVTVTNNLTSTSSSAALSAAQGKALADRLKTVEDNYASKSDIANAYIYRGSVATYAALPSTNQKAGDVYNVEATGMNYAWDGSKWDNLGEVFTITSITNAQIDTICV